MQDRRCVICKHMGNQFSSKLEQNTVYGHGDEPIRVILCRNHAVELFRCGQKRFFIRHYHILFDVLETQENAFLDVMYKTIKNSLDDIY